MLLKCLFICGSLWTLKRDVEVRSTEWPGLQKRPYNPAFDKQQSKRQLLGYSLGQLSKSGFKVHIKIQTYRFWCNIRNNRLNRLRLSSARNKWVFYTSTSFERCSSLNLFPLFHCKNIYCNVSVFTLNPEVEIRPSGEAQWKRFFRIKQ